MEPPAEAARGAHYFAPKEEVADDLGITYDYEEDMEAVIVREEWCDISQQLDGGVSERDGDVSEQDYDVSGQDSAVSGQDGGVSGQDGGVSGQDVIMVMPIKTELTLSDDLARLRTQPQLAEHGSVPQVLKVEFQPKAEADVAADCASTCVAPLSVKLATKHGNKVQVEETDTVQKSAHLLKIYYGEPDKRSFDTDGVTNINSLANRVVKLYDVLKTPKKFVPLQHELLIIAQRAATAVSIDLNCHVASQNEDIGSVTNKMNVNNNRNVSKTSQSGSKFSNTIDTSENSLFSVRSLFSCDVRKKCKLCDYRCAIEYDLVRHMRKHTGEKSYSCEFCDYRCAIKSNLVRHMRTHTGEKPYSCKLCKYRCGQKSQLVPHMRIHTGEKS